MAGVGVPFIGLYVIALFKGDYRAFFSQLGKLPAAALILFLMVIIGPLFAIPRTEILVYNTLFPYLSEASIRISNLHFSLIYFGILFLLAYRESRLMDIIGNFLSPIKILSFAFLITAALWLPSAFDVKPMDFKLAFLNGIDAGYSTMDLLGAFFFGSVAYHSTRKKTQNESGAIKMLLKSSVIGAILLSLVYLGFMIAAHRHANILHQQKIEALIGFIGKSVLGPWGGLVMGSCVALACLATALALINVFGRYLFCLLDQKLPLGCCLLFTTGLAYGMSLIEFRALQACLGVVLQICYPALIVFSILSIGLKNRDKINPNWLRIPTYVTVILTFIVLQYT